ncbi:eEF1-gamma domain-containing protein [Tilletiaria anomala UBC 951]|uniref:EEF1-gamma domain-containing protein n=1 Tax=Tilletiaria anomala (strain ATCC 24038 / CBS 436.72 / UBC 951) TaxID=1037660 RepID=A0A066VG36_TILAU|nr:eEF1-gamma domain-containing protein [Tilletiaria anomala UBC 951]KDN39258.1 eEF1-gamma domain-containing protein [Tilletiaria anomala UBC 951]
MAVIGKIYGGAPESPKVWRSLAAAKYAGVELEFVRASLRDGDCRKPEYLAKFPMGKIPAFEGADGFLLTESQAIARYVASYAKNANLLGADEKSSAQVQQWSSWGDEELFNKGLTILLPSFGFGAYNKEAEASAWEAIHRSLTYLNNYLNKNTFLVGHRVSLADLVVAGNLRMLFTSLAGEGVRNKYPNVTRYFNTVFGQPTIVDIVSKAELLKENFKFTAPKKEAAPAAAAAAAPAAGASAKKSKSKKKDDDDDDEEPLVPAEPKVKNPLDDLPKSPFILDEWKRVYSNQDTRKEALPWFFQNFDYDGYSVWRFDFKYNEELTQIFMSANQIGGFFNRLEASRKYVMGTAGVFGKANDGAIAGVVICRGKEYQPVLGVAPDLESYSVSPLDLKKDEDKKFFEDMLAWEASVNGKEWADGKILK